MKKSNLKQIPKNLDMKLFEQHLQNHAEVLLKEIKDNGGKPPKHRLDEMRKEGLI